MNQQVPNRMDVTDLQFKLQHKLNLFSNQNPPLDNTNLLASASTRGVVFVGGYETHLLVCPLSSLTNKDVSEDKLPHFKLQLQSRPHQISLSWDDAYLAVDVEINRNYFILIYSVDSIINQQPIILQQVKLADEDNVRSKQILWSPTQNHIFAVVLTNGGMSAYVLQDKGFQFYMLNKAEQAQCACWSPKGKQIVVGFRNGKIVQYKPDLKPARIIQCPPGTFGNAFQTIAIQWLSTYQFATIFLSDESPDATPSLHIVNAPKGGSPAIRNYGDICYSSPGPRKHQVFLIHLAQWNILLAVSANSMEVGILGTNETGDFPTWSQWITSDEARAELPLTEEKDDTYPIGFCIETGCTHNVYVGETMLPLMPMIHLLSMHGIFISFNVVNLKPNYMDICVPPSPLPDGLRWEIGVRKNKPVENANTSELNMTNPINQSAFQTSTPANEKSFFAPSEPPKSIASNLFGGNVTPKANVLTELNKPAMPPPNSQSSMFSMPNPAVQSQFSSTFNLLGGGQPKPTMNLTTSSQPKINQQQSNVVSQNQAASPKPSPKVTKPAEPIITVQPTFNKSLPAPDSKTNQSVMLKMTSSPGLDSKSDDAFDMTLITEEIQNFEADLKDVLNRTKKGKEMESNEKFFTTEYKNMVGTLAKLQDTMVQAMDATKTLKTDIHFVRLSLNEAFAMRSEAQSKHIIYNEPDYILIHENAGKNHTNQKQLSKLKSMLKANEIQFNDIYKTVYSQYSNFEDTKKQQSRDRMKIPSLQLVYQSINKQQDLIQHQRNAINLIKQKIGLNSSLISAGSKNSEESTTVESLTDSILSLSIADRVKAETSRFTDAKKKNLLEYLKNREVRIIKASRPENEFLISKIINGRKLMKENKSKVEKEAQTKAAIKVEPKPQVMAAQNSKAEMMPLAPSGQRVYKPSPVSASQAGPVQLPRFSGFSTSIAQFSEPPSNIANVDRKKKEAQKSPTTTLSTTVPLVFPGSGTGFTFNAPNTIATINKNEPITNTTQSSIFAEHNQKPSPNFGFGSSTSLFSNQNANKESPKLQDTKSTPNMNQTIPPSQIFAPKPIEALKSSTGKLTLQDVSNVDAKIITAMPSGVDFSLGSGLSITKVSEKPATVPQTSLSFSFKLPDKSAAEIKDAAENTSSEVKSNESPIKPAPLAVSQPQDAKLPSNVPTTLSMFQSVAVSSASTSVSNQTSSVSTTSAPITVSIALPVTATTTITTIVTTAAPIASGTAATTTSSTPFSFGSAISSSFSFANAFAAKTEASGTFEPNTENLFQSINICKPTTSPTSLTPKPENIFASAASNFGSATSTSSTLIFGGQTTITSTSSLPIFGTVPPNTTVTSAAPVTPASSTAVSSSTNIPFGVINLSAAKTEASVFSGFGTQTTATETTPPSNEFQSATNTSVFGGSSSVFGGTSAPSTTQVSQAPPTNLFGSALSFGSTNPSATSTSPAPFAIKAAETTAAASPFAGSPNTSIFGGSIGNTTAPATAFGFSPVVSNSSSGFGGVASGDSVFGMAATTSVSPTSSVFGSPVNSSATSGGSLFLGGFGTPNPSSGSIFGGGGSNASSDTQSNVFSFASKPDPGSLFASPSPFGQTAPSFGSPSGGAFSATPQAAPAFGSPSSFGGSGSPFGNTSPTFGGPATFGTTPTFGGTATFMSPTKSAFGAFGAAAAASQPQSPSFGGGGAPQQQNTLFEQLGSSDNGLSFGNLAQTANSNQNKPAFGGSAFMSWR